jgi:pimeloyl-ACP methyl ester carboxylesterase
VTYDDLHDDKPTEVSFMSGKNQLRGYIYGEENDQGLVVMAHGVGQGAERYLPETLFFANRGWRVFAFDATGSHASQGKGTMGLPQSLLDLHAAMTYIEGNPSLKGLPIMLFGHSWGGYSTAAILNYDHPIKAVVSVSGFNTPDELLLEQSRLMLGPFVYLEYPYEWAYQRMLFGSTARLSAVDGINHAGIPVMIIHGDQDESIAYTGSSIISHRAEITNPQVVYETISAEHRNGHMNLFSSNAALVYNKARNEEYQALSDQYQGNIPHEVKVAFYAGIDKSKTSELDADLMNGMNEFFERSLK